MIIIIIMYHFCMFLTGSQINNKDRHERHCTEENGHQKNNLAPSRAHDAVSCCSNSNSVDTLLIECHNVASGMVEKRASDSTVKKVDFVNDM